MKSRPKINTRMIYDNEADLLIIDYVPPYVGQDTDEVEDGVFVLSNQKTGNVEGVRILSFKKRFSKGFDLTLPSILKKRAS
jgi:uncharacterized protein YuzE